MSVVTAFTSVDDSSDSGGDACCRTRIGTRVSDLDNFRYFDFIIEIPRLLVG